MRASIIIAISAFVISACSGLGGSSDIYGYMSRDTLNHVSTYNIISTSVTMGTDKTLLDHVVSLQSGKDCSTVRVEQGRTYCREDEPNPLPEVHCYPSLGDVTCYKEPSRTRNLAERVGTPY